MAAATLVTPADLQDQDMSAARGDGPERLRLTPEPREYPHAARPAQIVVLVPSDRARAWVPRLADALRLQFGLPTRMVRPEPAMASHAPIPSEALEQLLFGAPRDGNSAWISTTHAATGEGLAWSDCLVVNATDRDPGKLPPEVVRATILSPSYHGLFEMEALAGPLLSGEPPHLGVVATRDGSSWLLQGARVAAPDRAVMPRALDAMFGRMVTLLRGAADHLITGRPLPEPSPLPPPHAVPSGLGFWSGRLLRADLPKLGRKLRKPFRRADDWCIGYRRLQAEAAPVDLTLDAASFQMVESPWTRFYADPFVLRHGGVTALFFEDYDYGEQRGRISYVVLGEDGSRGAPAEALSRPYHLSYPFVFAHEGAALMIPESSANRTVELYEAENFPDRWRLRSVLIHDIEASDTTLHFDEVTGLWWMFAAVSEFGSSSQDTLSIFFSDGIEGPWRPHAANPVKFDPGCSRPAGPLLRWNGRLFRPAQDCTSAYGEGLVWCEVKELTPDAFREEVVAHRRPSCGYTGLHTYGRAAGFEVVDFKRDRWRLGA